MVKKVKDYFQRHQKWISFLFIDVIILIVAVALFAEYGANIITLIFGLLALILNYFNCFKQEKFDKGLNFVIKYRYLFAFILFVFCVLFKISGSSIGIYSEMVKEKSDNTVVSQVFGKAKTIRADEYLVLTPYYISQVHENFPKYNQVISMSGQNMIIGYNAPVKDITTLAKPLNWGYMLFGEEYGLAWYWCSKLILLFLFSFEMFYIITSQNKKLSILGAIMIAFGPATQWWFAPHMPDVILWAMGTFVVIYHFFFNEKRWVRNLLTIILPLVVTEFIIALFPSFQVGLGYFILFVFLALLLRNRKNIFKMRESKIRTIFALILFLLLAGYFIGTNLNDLKTLNNTSYPGSRVETGGTLSVKDTFTDLGTIFLGYTNQSPYSNASEDSTYIHFGFFCLLLSPIIIKQLRRQKNRNWIVGATLVGIMAIEIIFMIFGFPEFLAKITLFSYINRMKMIFGFTSVVFTIWTFFALSKMETKINRSYYLLAVFCFSVLNLSFIDTALKDYLPVYFYYFEIAVFAFILLAFYYKWYKVFYASIIGLVLFASLPINPIVIGTSDVHNHPSAEKIVQLNEEEPDSYWVGYNHIFLSSYLLANGAKTWNAVNYYPDAKKWEILDPTGEYDDVYNRYSHIIVTLNKDENKIDYGDSPDATKVSLTLQTMYELKIRYILSYEDLEEFSKDEEYQLEKIYEDSDLKIYEIEKS